MRLVACLLLFSGFLLVLSALVLLRTMAERFVFTSAGLGVEILGLSLLAHAYKSLQAEGS